MALVLDDFVANPELSSLEKCKKAVLFAIANHYSIHVARSLRKDDLRAAVIRGLCDRGILVLSVDRTSAVEVNAAAGTPDGDDRSDVLSGAGSPVHDEAEATACVDVTPPVQVAKLEEKHPCTLPRFDPVSPESSGSKLDARLKLRLARLQMEQEERREEREFQLRRELELRKMDIEREALKVRQLELQKTPVSLASSAQNVPVLPAAFDVSKHISLVPVFCESEVEAYFGAFERIAGALNWPVNVWAILLQCKLVGKAQEARSALSVEDGLDYKKVKGAILRAYELVPEAYRQRFRSLCKMPDQSYIDFAREKETLFDRWCTASKADKLVSVRELMLLEKFKNCLPERTAVYLNEQKVSTLQQAAKLADEFTLTHKTVFVKRDSFQNKSTSKPDIQVRSINSVGPKPDRPCYYCLKSGHLIADCEAWKQRQKMASKQPKGVGLINTSPRASIESLAPEIPDCFKPFTCDGFVSVSGNAEDQRPIKILRDTACSQSLILSSVLPLNTRSEESAVVRGIEMGFVPAPLYYVHVTSEIATGFFKVGVRAEFPVNGIDFIMGNDIAGGKVYPVPKMVDVPIRESHDDVAIGHPDVFVASVLTRAQAHKNVQEVNLADSILGSALSKEESPSSGGAVSSRITEPEKETVSMTDSPVPLTREALIKAQGSDPSLAKCWAAVVDKSKCS
ncbi:uncharacterized protein LOC125900944 [Epinephelus fuscoguttatus]|uniref:uncharacterized protein LOC125900944 n=1 Tax=Epinephelus fuscoguttatus TaxID=293821 RepID=UPI0020D05FB7|nr:uncharacterized protein LOC125900944 [Epinephelus fuscoguttatus]XP_049452218.1 uncharacterized protein LOC125900944 [Epinephelus fuscoguttatus]XP_049452219.1 uncharacterized protein LOC125900944 [Epinephelus fuscoguttatus]